MQILRILFYFSLYIVIPLAGYILRIQPALTIKKEEIKKAFSILAESIEEYKAGEISDEVLTNRAGW